MAQLNPGLRAEAGPNRERHGERQGDQPTVMPAPEIMRDVAKE